MILTPHSVYARSGQPGGNNQFPILMMCVEEKLSFRMKEANRVDSDLLSYFFAIVFEDSTTCGESGIHQYMFSPEFSGRSFPIAGFPSKMVPIRVALLITLDEYDDLRLRRKEWEGKFSNKHPFPEYAKLESRVGS